MTDYAESLKMTSKDKVGLLSSWKEFGLQASRRVENIINKLTDEINSFSNNINIQQVNIIQEKTRVVRLKEKIELFLSNVNSDWLLDSQDSGKLIFRPLWMTQELAEQYLWRHADKFVLMSASLYPKPILAKCLGINTDDMDYHEVPSQFPIANRPVYCIPVVSMTAKTTETELPVLITAIRHIIDCYPDVKGIIHCVSYALANKIMVGVNSSRFITHNSLDRQQVIDKFIQSTRHL
jgi:Rad3-related DNA helicase